MRAIDLQALRRDAEASAYKTVPGAYGLVPVGGGELLALLDEVERLRAFRQSVVVEILSWQNEAPPC